MIGISPNALPSLVWIMTFRRILDSMDQSLRTVMTVSYKGMITDQSLYFSSKVTSFSFLATTGTRLWAWTGRGGVTGATICSAWAKISGHPFRAPKISRAITKSGHRFFLGWREKGFKFFGAGC